jgi:hypothetical protein
MIRVWLKPWVDKNANYDMSVLEYECRTCNFLTGNRNGAYSFAHKSFMEYLMASALIRELFETRTDVGRSWVLPLKTQTKLASRAPVGTKELQHFAVELASARQDFQSGIAEFEANEVGTLTTDDRGLEYPFHSHMRGAGSNWLRRSRALFRSTRNGKSAKRSSGGGGERRRNTTRASGGRAGRANS